MQNIKKILLYGAAVLGIILTVFAVGTMRLNDRAGKAGLNSQFPVAGASNTQGAISLEPQINDEAGVSIEAAPIEFSAAGPVKFNIIFTTHQGDLGFDLLKQAALFDNQGREYAPQSWDGGSGGHHLQGALIFPALPAATTKMRLVIKNIYGVAKRAFEWRLSQ